MKRKEKITKKPTDDKHLISLGVYDKLLEQENPDVILLLYSFYCRTAIRQNTNQVWATNNYCIKGTKLGKDKFYRAKKRLIELKLIAPIKGIDCNGQFKKQYIKVNYTWEENYRALNHTKKGLNPHSTENRITSYKGLHPHSTENPHCGETVHKCFKKYLNKYSFIEKTVNSFVKCLPVEWQDNEKLKSSINRYVRFRQVTKYNLDAPLMKKLASILAKMHTPKEAIASMDKAIKNGWRGLNPVHPKTKKRAPIYDEGIKYVWEPKSQTYRHCVSGALYIP